MAVSKELIDRKVKQYKALLEDLNTLEKSLANDLIELDKQAFGGMTWGEYLSNINPTNSKIQVNENISIYRNSYKIYGTYVLFKDESPKSGTYATLHISGNIYYGDTRFESTFLYEESGRTLQECPKRYKALYDRLVREMQKYQVKRPSDEYSKPLGITHRL